MAMRKPEGFGVVNRRKRGQKAKKGADVNMKMMSTTGDPLYGLALEDDDFIFQKPGPTKPNKTKSIEIGTKM